MEFTWEKTDQYASTTLKQYTAYYSNIWLPHYSLYSFICSIPSWLSHPVLKKSHSWGTFQSLRIIIISVWKRPSIDWGNADNTPKIKKVLDRIFNHFCRTLGMQYRQCKTLNHRSFISFWHCTSFIPFVFIKWQTEIPLTYTSKGCSTFTPPIYLVAGCNTSQKKAFLPN